MSLLSPSGSAAQSDGDMANKEFLKNYRLGFSKNYLDKSRYKAVDNFPKYGVPDSLVKKHLTEEVSDHN